MPRQSNIVEFVKKSIKASKDPHPTTAIVVRVDGNVADIRLEGHSTNITNCRITGDPRAVKVGMLATIIWEDYNGTLRPSVSAGGSGINLSATGGSTVLVDNTTIENSQYGLRVKMGSITPAHMSWDIDTANSIEDILPNWSVSPEGILYSNSLSISPAGSITLGQTPDVVKISTEDATYRIWAGNIAPASAPFSVSKTGHLISSSATIAGWTISSTQIYKVGIRLDSQQDQITVGPGEQIVLDGGSSTIAIGTGNQIVMDGVNRTITVGSSGDKIVIDGANKYIKNSGYSESVSGFIINADGSAEFGNVRVRGSISASVFEYGDIQATAGTLFISRSAAKIYSDYTTPGSIGSSNGISLVDDTQGNELISVITGRIATISINSGGTGYAKGDILTIVKSGGTGGKVEVAQVSSGVITEVLMNNRGSGYTTGAATSSGGSGSSATFTINSVKTEGDILWLKTLTPTGVAQAWLEVGGKSSQSGYTIYTPVYLRSGDTSTTFNEGVGVASLGIHNEGAIYLSADDIIGSSANITFIEWFRNAVSTVSVVAGGSNYYVGDILRLQDANSFIPCRVKVTGVSGTAVTSVAIYGGEIGSDYTTGTKSTYAEQYSWGTRPTGCTINITALKNPWNGSQTTFGRLGNIAGAYGATSEDKYGFGFGNYASGNYISYNAELDETFVLSANKGGITISPDGIVLTNVPNDWANNISFFTDTQMTFRINSYENPDYYQALTEIEAWAQSGWHPRVIISAYGLSGTIPTVAIRSTGSAGYANVEVYGQSGAGTINLEAEKIINAAPFTNALRSEGSTLYYYSQNGVELSWQGTYGRLLSYKRGTGAADTPLQIRASYIDFYEGGTPRFRIDGANLQKYINSGFTTTYQYVPLYTPADDLTNWDGQTHSDVSTSTAIYLNNFGIPDYVKAVDVQLMAIDSGTHPQTGLYFAVGPSTTYWWTIVARPIGSGLNYEIRGICPITSSATPTMYYRINASGSNTMQCWIRIWGYWI